MTSDDTRQALEHLSLSEVERLNAEYRSRKFVGVSDLAAQLGVSTRTLRRRKHAGLMPALRHDGHRVGYHEADIEEWLQASGFKRLTTKVEE